MAESTTPRFGLHRWTEDTDTPHRTEFDTAHANIESYAAGYVWGTAAARPAAAAAYDRFFYWAHDTDEVTMCVDTTGAGGWSWVRVDAATSAELTSHIADTAAHSATALATASRIVMRDAAGRAQFASPSAAADAVIKSYADALGVSTATASTIMRRDAAGRVAVAEPSATGDATTKNYVDTQVATKPASVNVQVFTASGTWTKPAGAKTVYVDVISAGGAGGASGSSTYGGGGGGGGCRITIEVNAATLASSETVTVGAGGVGASTGTANATAAAGGISTFGTFRAGGGQGGYIPGTTTQGGAGGSPWDMSNPFSQSAKGGMGGIGGTGGSAGSGAGGNAEYGGAGGGNGASSTGYNSTTGGNSVFGGAGGGGGGNSSFTGGSAGGTGQTFNDGGGGHGGKGGSSTVAPVSGTIPAGGGGGAYAGQVAGSGARGEVRVYTHF